MIKKQELVDPNGCMVRAKPDEMTFVLLARDICAPRTIRFWALERIATGKNKRTDPQIEDAFACAAFMEKQREQVKALPDASPPYVNDDARDAARYRWLRAESLKGKSVVVNYNIGHDWTHVTELEELDSMIDDALSTISNCSQETP